MGDAEAKISDGGTGGSIVDVGAVGDVFALLHDCEGKHDFGGEVVGEGESHGCVADQGIGDRAAKFLRTVGRAKVDGEGRASVIEQEGSGEARGAVGVEVSGAFDGEKGASGGGGLDGIEAKSVTGVVLGEGKARAQSS